MLLRVCWLNLEPWLTSELQLTADLQLILHIPFGGRLLGVEPEWAKVAGAFHNGLRLLKNDDHAWATLVGDLDGIVDAIRPGANLSNPALSRGPKPQQPAALSPQPQASAAAALNRSPQI